METWHQEDGLGSTPARQPPVQTLGSMPAIPHPWSDHHESRLLPRSNSADRALGLESGVNEGIKSHSRRDFRTEVSSPPLLESLERELERTKRETTEKELDVVMLKAKSWRLERKIRQLRKDDSGTDSDEEDSRPFNLPQTTPVEFPPASFRNGIRPAGHDMTPKKPLDLKEPVIPGTADSMVSVNGTEAPPPCIYSCFWAGPPILCTILNDIGTLGFHLWRSFEVTRLSSCNLASGAEKNILKDKYKLGCAQLSILNFLVWRRSVLLLLLVSSFGALIFAIVGDTWNTWQHMNDMKDYSKIEVTFEGWSSRTMAKLPNVSCEVIDENFAGKLNSMSSMHQVMGTVVQSCSTTGSSGVGAGHHCVFPFIFAGVTYDKCTPIGHLVPWCSTGTDEYGNHINSQWGDCKCTNSVDTSCSALMQRGADCDQTVDRYVVGCWEAAFCEEKLRAHCPSACTHNQPLGDATKSGVTDGCGELCCPDIRKTQVDFETFGIAFTKATLYKIMELLSCAELKQLFFSICCKVVAVAALICATIFWTDWAQSNRLVLFAWVVTFASPFLRSIVPTPYLIDWRPIDAQLNQFVNVTDQHFDLSTKMHTLKHAAGLGCDSDHIVNKMDHTWAMAHHKVHWWCGKIQWGSTWFPWSSVLRKGSYQCQVFTNYMGVGDVATVEVRTEKQKLCKLINSTHTDVKEGSIQGVSDVIDVSWLRSAAYALVGGMSSLLSFRVVLPEALSIAPGLLTAAIRIKVMVPQSYLSGIFIVLMPLLYVPMIWAFCLFIVQGVGDPLLLVAMTCLAFSPLAFTILGFSRRVTAPMGKVGVKAFTKCVQYWQNLLYLIALACLLAYFVKLGMHIEEIEESKTGISAFLLEQSQKFLLPLLVGRIDSILSMVFSGPLWSIIFTFLMELYLTMIVGADFMLRASAEEWEQKDQEYLVELKEEGGLDDVADVKKHHLDRVACMTAMLELTAKRRNKESTP